MNWHAFLLLTASVLIGSTLTNFTDAHARGGTEDPSMGAAGIRKGLLHDDQDTEAEAEADIVVAGHPPTDFGLLTSTATLEGDSLIAATRGQLGETLAKLPGVSATSFAPGASRPVLRGFDGDRIRVLLDGIGSVDASSVSADHAVVFDPLTVDHIDVVHGPAALLFGGQAIGGAINAIDKRIPRMVPDNINATAIGGYGTAADERSAGGAVQLPLADRLVVHFDGSWRKSDNLRVGGLVNSPQLRAELLDEAAQYRNAGESAQADTLEELAGQSGHVANSAARSSTLGAGIAFIDTGGNLGVSIQHYDSRYGVPERPTAETADPVSIDLVQTRVDMRGAVNLSGWLDSLQLRGAYGDYRHIELEGDEEGTRFGGKGFEFRSDLVQASHGGWRGRSGIQLQGRKMTIAGAEAVVPDNEVARFGIFTLQSVYLGSGFEVEAAGRYERASVKSNPAGYDHSFDLWSGAIGASREFTKGWKIGANYIRGARAPAPEELLSNGLHIATQSYELGNPRFVAELSSGFEAYVRYNGSHAEFSLTGYQTNFGNFIAALPTGAAVEGFPVFLYAQLPARFWGFEASGSVEAMRWDNGELRLDAAADYTNARLKDIGPVPRIPPLRLRGGAEVHQGALQLRGEIEWNDAQDRVATFENKVPGFTFVNLSADWHPLGENGPLTLILSANNLFDVVARRASSFTRDFVPLAGRDIRLSANISF